MEVETKNNMKQTQKEEIEETSYIRETIENPKKEKTKRKKKKRKIFLFLKILLVLIILGIGFIYVFFKTDLFQEYKELWVQTAMTTMNHQYLATWFLSDEEIEEIMKKLEVQNNENSNSDNIMVVEIQHEENKKVTVEKITGKGYVGFVMIVPDASKVKLVDGRQARKRLKIK